MKAFVGTSILWVCILALIACGGDKGGRDAGLDGSGDVPLEDAGDSGDSGDGSDARDGGDEDTVSDLDGQDGSDDGSDIVPGPVPVLVVEVLPTAGGFGYDTVHGVGVNVPGESVEEPWMVKVFAADVPEVTPVTAPSGDLEGRLTVGSPFRVVVDGDGSTPPSGALVLRVAPALDVAGYAVPLTFDGTSWSSSADHGVPVGPGFGDPFDGALLPLAAYDAVAVGRVDESAADCVGPRGFGCDDTDSDGVRDAVDTCPGVADASQEDQDGDGYGDACDVCPGTADDQSDVDDDGIGDACNPCSDGAGEAIDCDDGDPCNGTETCVPAAGCVSSGGLVCDDGDPCNGVEQCDPIVGCVGGRDLSCDDGNPCTSGTCAEDGCTQTLDPMCSLAVTVEPETGGSGTAASSRLGLAAPPASVVETTLVTAEPTPDLSALPAADVDLAASSHRFEPDGQLFETTIRLTLPILPGMVPDGAVVDPDELVPVQRFDPESDSWERATLRDGTPITAQVSSDATEVSFETDHFTDYAFGTACTPDCSGRTCGPDGCGGFCGSCDDGDPCTLDLCARDDGPVRCEHTYDTVCLSDRTCTENAECYDGNPCTADVCTDSGVCGHSYLADGTACTVLSSCREPLACRSGRCLPPLEAELPSWCDGDFDGIADTADNCPAVWNATQGDTDDDGDGDACDADRDGDGVTNGDDNCPYAYNPGQIDTDDDGLGDRCPIGDVALDLSASELVNDPVTAVVAGADDRLYAARYRFGLSRFSEREGWRELDTGARMKGDVQLLRAGDRVYALAMSDADGGLAPRMVHFGPAGEQGGASPPAGFIGLPLVAADGADLWAAGVAADGTWAAVSRYDAAADAWSDLEPVPYPGPDFEVEAVAADAGRVVVDVTGTVLTRSSSGAWATLLPRAEGDRSGLVWVDGELYSGARYRPGGDTDACLVRWDGTEWRTAATGGPGSWIHRLFVANGEPWATNGYGELFHVEDGVCVGIGPDLWRTGGHLPSSVTPYLGGLVVGFGWDPNRFEPSVSAVLRYRAPLLTDQGLEVGEWQPLGESAPLGVGGSKVVQLGAFRDRAALVTERWNGSLAAYDLVGSNAWRFLGPVGELIRPLEGVAYGVDQVVLNDGGLWLAGKAGVEHWDGAEWRSLGVSGRVGEIGFAGNSMFAIAGPLSLLYFGTHAAVAQYDLANEMWRPIVHRQTWAPTTRVVGPYLLVPTGSTLMTGEVLDAPALWNGATFETLPIEPGAWGGVWTAAGDLCLSGRFTRAGDMEFDGSQQRIACRDPDGAWSEPFADAIAGLELPDPTPGVEWRDGEALARMTARPWAFTWSSATGLHSQPWPTDMTVRAIHEADDWGTSWSGQLRRFSLAPFDTGDWDRDGADGQAEFAAGSSPFDPNSDLDRLTDAEEIDFGTDPTDEDTDDDGKWDDVDGCPTTFDAPDETGVEACNDGIDNDCDGATDCADPECMGVVCEPIEEGELCRTPGTCNSRGECAGAGPVNCNDFDGCTTDSCDPETGCVHTAIVCADEEACTYDGCLSTSEDTWECFFDGSPHEGDPCDDDGNPCTVDTCSAGACTHAPSATLDGVSCDGDDPCQTAACRGGECLPDGGIVTCDDADPCTIDTCLASVGCQETACPTGSGYTCGAEDPVCRDPSRDTVHVPAGAFWMGCDELLTSVCQPATLPMHQVTMSAFDIDRDEVTGSEYTACVTDGPCAITLINLAQCPNDPAGLPDRPATCVLYDEAATYCGWVGGRLCTEAEWEKAARGPDGRRFTAATPVQWLRFFFPTAEDGTWAITLGGTRFEFVASSNTYIEIAQGFAALIDADERFEAREEGGGLWVWAVDPGVSWEFTSERPGTTLGVTVVEGTDMGCTQANRSGCNDTTIDVGLTVDGASPYGALDMLGNASEWVADYWAEDAYASHAATDPTGPETGTDRVIRGGNWSGSTSDVWGREHGSGGPARVGFRCCYDPM